jgi:hypothetical protein
VNTVQLADVEQAVTAIRSESTKPIAFGEAVVEACKRVAEGGSAGRSKTRVVIHLCAGCHKATREGKNGFVEISPSELETRACNSELLDIRRGPAPLSRTIPPMIENFVRARDHDRCRVPGCKNRAHVNLHHEGGWRTVAHDPLAVYVLCVAHHTAIHSGDLIVRAFGSGRFEFRRRDRGLIGRLDLNLPMEDPAAFRAEGSALEAVRGDDHETCRAAVPTVETRVTDPRAEACRTAGPPSREIAGEAAVAEAFLRKLEFRGAVARDLVRRAVRSMPQASATADEIVQVALKLSKN